MGATGVGVTGVTGATGVVAFGFIISCMPVVLPCPASYSSLLASAGLSIAEEISVGEYPSDFNVLIVESTYCCPAGPTEFVTVSICAGSRPAVVKLLISVGVTPWPSDDTSVGDQPLDAKLVNDAGFIPLARALAISSGLNPSLANDMASGALIPEGNDDISLGVQSPF